MTERQAELRRLPSVDALLGRPEVADLVATSGHALATAAVREVLDEARQAILAGASAPDHAALAAAAAEHIQGWLRPSLRPVINASGVILQTNLGRAPLSEAAIEAMRQAAAYSNLEYDLEAGRRGARYVHAERALRQVTGAEAALVTNNNAGAILLVLSALARGREVVVSRGQLVEVGGGFRIPDVLRESGAHLVEVGTTNRTYARDFEAACGPETALLLQVHTSNFRLTGFVHQPETAELAELARARGLHLVVDQGSGVLLDTAAYGLSHEPTVQEYLQAGADLVTFSGDKLLGGPQAGIVVGQAELVASLRRHPLMRALRVDKLTLAALDATLAAYQAGRAADEIPVWRMISLAPEEVRRRAQRLARRLGAEVVPGRSTVGGGSLPGETLPTYLIALRVPSPDALARRLRLGQPPVVGRIEEGRFLLDLRTVLPSEEAALLHALTQALAD